MDNYLSPERAAELMGASPQFVRIGLRQGELPFGWAVKMGEKSYRYYISKPKFEECTGIKVDEEKKD